jgi:hypothetical protein
LNFVPFNSDQNNNNNNNGDGYGYGDGDDNSDADDNSDGNDDDNNDVFENGDVPDNNSSSSNFVTFLPSHAFSLSLPSVPVVPVTSSVPAISKSLLTLEQAELQYKDLIGGANQ